MIQAKKQFGQHFLKSASALSHIVNASNPTADDTILEIGPGTGILTEKLLSVASTVIAVEKDRDLIPLLREKFSADIASGKLQLIEQDVLDFDPHTIKTPYKLVANIPYYITGAILEKFLSAEVQPRVAVLLVQKEVAERIVARNNKESILSISVKVYGTPSIVAKVPRGAFAPPPSVDSAILLIKDISRSFFTDCDEKLFFEIVKTTFGQKRKTIGKTLSEKYGPRAITALAAAAVDPKTRPEDITPAFWKKLCQALVREVVH